MKEHDAAPFRRKEDLCLGYSPDRVAGTFAAQAFPLNREAKYLRRRGVPAASLEHVRYGYIVRQQHTFEFDQHLEQGRSERAYLFLVDDLQGLHIDVVGWMPAEGGWLGTWRGFAWALGQDSTFKPRLTEHRALRVHRSPLGWLQNGCNGVVVIQARLAAEFLCDAGPLLADDVEHGTELKEALTRRAPRILVSMEGRAR